ncbi:serine hydrolase [Hamadaea sp. NPDC051192]|uniref:serine hydrolase n=1 Tax=Hamadaea sp. NPDC051192 TaxID=3154940 RepID=UPI003449BA9E
MEDTTHRPQLSRRRLMGILAGGIAASAVGGVGIFTTQSGGNAAAPSPAPATTSSSAAAGSTSASAAEKTVTPVVRVQTDEDTWYAWQWVNLTTGATYGSADAAKQTNNTESMIKAWIGADYLAGLEASGQPLSDADNALITKMIKKSDNAAAQTLYLRRGGDQVIQRAIDECGLTGTAITESWWSKTQITALDATRMMREILTRAETSELVRWLVDDLMRNVDDDNAFGIAQALAETDPQADPAVKNGWTDHANTGLWNLNCLAEWTSTGTGDHIVLAILTRYPLGYGQAYGEKVCREVTSQLLGQLTVQA